LLAASGATHSVVQARNDYDVNVMCSVCCCQAETIPLMMDGKNVLCAAETGNSCELMYSFSYLLLMPKWQFSLQYVKGFVTVLLKLFVII